MKRSFFLLVMFMTFLCASAQDTIRFRNGRVEAAKVMEVGLGKVKYKKINNPDGPLFLLDEAEVESIKFQNGDVEVFGKTVEADVPVQVKEERIVEVKVDSVVIEKKYPLNSAKYPLSYRKGSPSTLAFDSKYLSLQEAYEILGNNYEVFRENVYRYRTGRAMWIAGGCLVFVSGPIAIGAAVNDSYRARHVALISLCSGGVLFTAGMVRFVSGKRTSKDVLRNYNFDYNSKRQNVSELKFGLTGNGVGVNLTF